MGCRSEALVKSGRWSNWGRNQSADPARRYTPTSEEEVGALVSRGVAERRTVRAVGSGHSFSDIAVTNGLMIDMSRFDDISKVDIATRRVTVGSGVVLADLNQRLREVGLALPNLGDIDAQTLAGATATATHGTGINHQCISAAIVGARLVSGDGGLVDIDEFNRPDLLGPVRCSLGALGIVTEMTLQCVPAFNLHAVESTHDVDEVLERFPTLSANNDHVEFYWFPHTRTAQLKVNNKTSEPEGNARLARFVNDEVLANAGFGLLNVAGRRIPGVVAPVMRAAMKPGQRAEYVAASHAVFCSPRRVRFIEMEYAIPAESVLEAFNRVRDAVSRVGRPISFPIEVRVLGRDNIPLSMASGRVSAFIAVHVPTRTRFDDYFSRIEEIMNDYGGRPHWGKLHFQTAETLAPRYPDWGDFHAALRELDPDGHFANDYLSRVLRGEDFRQMIGERHRGD
ncbi:MAG: D-arabinono-1,4-lactone oxidase [Acidimicrobiales bacterium]